MKYVILLLLIIPLISAQTFHETLNVTTNTSVTIINITTEVQTQTESLTQEEVCQPFIIKGVPTFINNKETVQYHFSNFQEGDNITYWIEDAYGDIVKDTYTTSNNNKKSYTPSIDEKEKSLVIKATRERQHCNETSAKKLFVVLGEAQEEIIEEQTCEYEQPITSFYVRAKNYNEEINLYGKTMQEGNYVLIGEARPRTIFLEPGSFKISIRPQQHNNTFGIAQESFIKTTSFYLKTEDDVEKAEIIEEPEQNETIPSNFSFPATGNITLENNTKTNTSLLVAITGLAGISLGVSGLKTKVLRRKHDSA